MSAFALRQYESPSWDNARPYREATKIRLHSDRSSLWKEPQPSGFDQFLEKLIAIANLDENWDGYGGKVVDSQILSRAAEIAIGLAETYRIPMPSLVPLSYGGVQIEWHLAGIDVEIEFEWPSRLHLYHSDGKREVHYEAQVDLSVLSEPLKAMHKKLNPNRGAF